MSIPSNHLSQMPVFIYTLRLLFLSGNKPNHTSSVTLLCLMTWRDRNMLVSVNEYACAHFVLFGDRRTCHKLPALGFGSSPAPPAQQCLLPTRPIFPGSCLVHTKHAQKPQLNLGVLGPTGKVQAWVQIWTLSNPVLVGNVIGSLAARAQLLLLFDTCPSLAFVAVACGIGHGGSLLA